MASPSMVGLEFWSLDLGNLLTIFSILGVGVGFIYTVKGRVDALYERMLRVEEGIKHLVDVLIEQGKQAERLTLIAERLQFQGRRQDEADRRMNRMQEDLLRHGKAWTTIIGRETAEKANCRS